jgi:hypothetical protein
MARGLTYTHRNACARWSASAVGSTLPFVGAGLRTDFALPLVGAGPPPIGRGRGLPHLVRPPIGRGLWPPSFGRGRGLVGGRPTHWLGRGLLSLVGG